MNGELYQQYKKIYKRGFRLYNEGLEAAARKYLSDAVGMLQDLMGQEDATIDEKAMYGYMITNIKDFIATRIDSKQSIEDDNYSELECCA